MRFTPFNDHTCKLQLYFVEIFETSFFLRGTVIEAQLQLKSHKRSSLLPSYPSTPSPRHPTPHIGSTRGCIFLQLSRQFKQSAYLFRECLAAPLVHVLGNTIWPQVPFVYLKPSVSARLLPVLIVSHVSSHFTSTLII